MTNWHPQIPDGQGPLYHAAGGSGSPQTSPPARSQPERKLPPQRDLAYDLGVTVGTIGRAYATIRQRGLVNGEVGRGTFVLGSAEPIQLQESYKTEPRAADGQRPVRPAVSRRRVRVPFLGARCAMAAAEAIPLLPARGSPCPRIERHPLRQHIGPGNRTGGADRRLTLDITRDHPHEIASYTRAVPDRLARAPGRSGCHAAAGNRRKAVSFRPPARRRRSWRSSRRPQRPATGSPSRI
jgi:hypothetical protein